MSGRGRLVQSLVALVLPVAERKAEALEVAHSLPPLPRV
jgi:hypothetical protein